jgi:hypothetical protein
MTNQKANIKRQRAKGRYFIYSFDFAFGSHRDFLKSGKMALHPNRLLPLALCFLRFDLPQAAFAF